jgi:hypothetical protein
MPYELLGKFRRMLIYALWRPKLRAIYRVARIFLGMISGRVGRICRDILNGEWVKKGGL